MIGPACLCVRLMLLNTFEITAFNQKNFLYRATEYRCCYKPNINKNNSAALRPYNFESIITTT
jgi:hypothetical protein